MIFGELLENVVEESIPLAGGILKVGFLPMQVTNEELLKIQSDELEPEVRRQATCEFLAKGVKYWSMKISETEDLPPTVETFARKDFPESLLIALIERLGKLVQNPTGKPK